MKDLRAPPTLDAPAADGAHAFLARLRARDPEALRAYYEAHAQPLHAFLVRLTRDQALARDIGQDVWLRLAVNAERLAPDSDVRAWLFTVARNLVRSHARFGVLSRARLREHWLALRPARPALDDVVSARREGRALELALAELPIAQRELVLLVSIEGYSTSDVARMLGLSEVAVRQRLARARARLKAAFSQRGGEGDG